MSNKINNLTIDTGPFSSRTSAQAALAHALERNLAPYKGSTLQIRTPPTIVTQTALGHATTFKGYARFAILTTPGDNHE